MGVPQSPADSIPAFRLPASTGQTLELGSFKDKVPLVLLFLRPDSDDELLSAVNKRLKDFGSERSQVLVVAHLTAKETRELAEERGLVLPVLADATGSMARDFGAGEQSGLPAAVVADKTGHLVRRFDPLPDEAPDEVVDALLYAIRAIGSGTLIPGDHDSTE
jgi:peroxiredoxin